MEVKPFQPILPVKDSTITIGSVLRTTLELYAAGSWRLGRGQFTDDVELALSLANGLLLHEGTTHTFPAEEVAQQYIK